MENDLRPNREERQQIMRVEQRFQREGRFSSPHETNIQQQAVNTAAPGLPPEIPVKEIAVTSSNEQLQPEEEETKESPAPTPEGAIEDWVQIAVDIPVEKDKRVYVKKDAFEQLQKDDPAGADILQHRGPTAYDEELKRRNTAESTRKAAEKAEIEKRNAETEARNLEARNQAISEFQYTHPEVTPAQLYEMFVPQPKGGSGSPGIDYLTSFMKEYNKTHEDKIHDLYQAKEKVATEVFEIAPDELKILLDTFRKDPYSNQFGGTEEQRQILAILNNIDYSPAERESVIMRDYTPVGTVISIGNFQAMVADEYAKKHNMSPSEARRLFDIAREKPDSQEILRMSEEDKQDLFNQASREARGFDIISKADLKLIQAYKDAGGGDEGYQAYLDYFTKREAGYRLAGSYFTAAEAWANSHSSMSYVFLIISAYQFLKGVSLVLAENTPSRGISQFKGIINKMKSWFYRRALS